MDRERPRVLILRNPRETGGPTAHIKGWRNSLDALGCDVVEIKPTVRWKQPWRHASSLAAVLLGKSVPEAIVWSGGDIRQAVTDHRPDLILAHTSRTLLPVLGEFDVPVVIDFVDQLSTSYQQRAEVASTARSFAFRLLAMWHRRVETNPPAPAKRVAVGAGDAAALDARWIALLPEINPTLPAVDWTDRTFDVVFFGSLNYPPNVEAIRWLASAPDLGRISVLIAGRRATDDLRQLIADAGWTLHEDYESVPHLADLARIAVVPLQSAAGIQIKVFEAALAGLPQVITSPARAGFGVPIPAIHADAPDEFVDGIRSLLSDRTAAEELADRARQTVVERYSVEAWLPEIADVLGFEWPTDDQRPSAPSTSRTVRATIRASNTSP